MKLKLFVVAIASMLSMFSHAAFCTWQLDCYDFGSDVSGYTLFIIDSADGASSYASNLSGKSYADASEFLTAIGDSAGTLDGDAYAQGSYNGSASYLSALIIASTDEGANIYYTEGLSLSGHTYEAGEPQASPLEIWDTDFKNGGVIAYGTGGGGAPEPTSGLLLLIGGSLLALRRKQK